MIKFEGDMKSGVTKLVAIGDVEQLTTETLVLVKKIYDSLVMNSDVAAGRYISSIVFCCTKPTSPMFKKEEAHEQKTEP